VVGSRRLEVSFIVTFDEILDDAHELFIDQPPEYHVPYQWLSEKFLLIENPFWDNPSGCIMCWRMRAFWVKYSVSNIPNFELILELLFILNPNCLPKIILNYYLDWLCFFFQNMTFIWLKLNHCIYVLSAFRCT